MDIPFHALEHGGPFQRDAVPLPISFGRVLDHRMSKSVSALFKVPVEILGLILGFVDSSSLAALALVNSDCLELSRSRQFADVRFDYSESSEALVRQLVSQSSEKWINKGSTSLPSLGIYIRRLTVSIDINNVRERFGIQKATSSENGITLREAVQPQWEDIFASIAETYLYPIQAMICSTNTLPNLNTVDWEEQYDLSQNFYNSIARSSVRHLKLNYSITQVFEISLPQSRVWPLRNLHLELACDISQKDMTSTLCASILRRCTSSLETLVWIQRRHRDHLTFGKGPIPKFPCLRNLHLQLLEEADASLIDAFFPAKLVNLRIIGGTSLLDKAISSCGQIPSLEALSIRHHTPSFLQANPQLLKVDFDRAELSPISLETQILPSLSNLSNLTSLRISWPKLCSQLPEKGLQLIGSLRNLTQLCISCGRVDGWRRNWEVDHSAIRQNLSPLRVLQRLALCGDTYSPGSRPTDLSRYYVDTFAVVEDLGYPPGMPLGNVPLSVRTLMLDCQIGKSYWEKAHRKKVISEGMAYIDVFPRLEWIYLGERAMCIEEVDGQIKSRCIVSIDEMADSGSYLSCMFEI